MAGDDPTPLDGLRQVFRRENEAWTIVFAGRRCQLRDTRGMRCLAYLLVRPHQPVTSVEIEQVTRDDVPPAETADSPSAAERARVNVTRALSAALRRIEPHHPELAQHLRATVRAGSSCTYSPDPRLPSRWES